MISPLHMTTIVRLTKHRHVVAGELQPFTFLWGGGGGPETPPARPRGGGGRAPHRNTPLLPPMEGCHVM